MKIRDFIALVLVVGIVGYVSVPTEYISAAWEYGAMKASDPHVRWGVIGGLLVISCIVAWLRFGPRDPIFEGERGEGEGSEALEKERSE